MLPDRFRSREEWSFPNIVNVCVIRGSCNASCRHCPVGLLPQDKRKERFGDENISDALFKKIVDEISGFRHSTLRIHGVGEPTLWKGLAEGLKYANKKKGQNLVIYQRNNK